MMQLNDTRYTKIPLKDVTEPKNGLFQIYKDYWWVITPDQEVLKFYGCSMQCNTFKEIVLRLCPDGCIVEQIPFVYIPINPHDYC